MAKKLTSTKARKILHDKEVHGHPLTDKQRRFFGAIAGGAEPYNAQIGTMLTSLPANYMETLSEALGFPQKAVTKMVTGKYQTPSEALGIQNAAGAFLTDVVLDPLGLLGIGAAKKMGALDDVYKINPLAKKTLSDPNKSYRVAGMDAYDDFVESGFLRSKTPMPQPGMSLAEKAKQRPTAFPSFQKGFADLRYLPKEGGVVFETSLPTFKRGEINPVTGFPVKGRHYAHRVIDPETGKTLSRIPGKDIKVFEPKPHWLRGYKEVKPPKKKQDGGWLDKYDAPQAQNGIEGTMGGLTDKGFNYNGAWGGPSMQMGGNIMPAMAGANQTVPMYQMGGVLPGAVGFTYARTAGAAPANGPYAKKTKASAQNGQEMKYYQEGLDFKPKTISKNGGWLDKYDAPQAQDGDDILDYLKKGKPAPVVTKGKPLTAEQQKRITAETLKRQTQRSKPLTATNTREQAVEKGRAENLRVIEENKEYDRQAMAEGKAAEATRENPNVPFTFPTGESKLWKDMDWRERQYVSGRNLGSMSRSNNWTDWINPITMIGEMGEGLATAPYMARETDSNLPYVAGIASPLLGGALGGLGTRNTGQFVNNIINPLAGMDFSSKELSSIPGTKTTSGLFGRSKPKIGPNEELGILPSGVKSDRHISHDDVQSIFKKESEWLRSDEYLRRRIAATGENPIAVRKDIEQAISRFANIAVNVGKRAKNTRGTYDFRNNVITLSPNLTKTQALATLDHEIKHALSQLSTTGFKRYGKYPTTPLGNVLTRNFSMPRHMMYLNQPWEQQVRKLRLLDFINESQGVPRGQKLTMKNIEQLAEDVKPATANEPAGFFAQDFSNRFGDVQEGYISGVIQANQKLKFVPQNLLKMKFPFKLQRQSNQAIRQTLLDQLNKAYAVPFGASAVGAASMSSGESEQAPKQQDGGDIPVDPMGYWNPENVGGPVIIPSNVITMEGVDQPLLGISDTGDVQYMIPGEDYEFDGEYVTEYPVAKKGVSVNKADENPKQKLDQLLNFTNYNKPTKGGWLDKYN